MSNQELKTTVLNPVSQVIVFSHVSPICSLKCSHEIIFLIFSFQMSYSLHSPTPPKVDPQQQWGRVIMNKFVDDEKLF